MKKKYLINKKNYNNINKKTNKKIIKKLTLNS